MKDSISIFEDYLETQADDTPLWYSVLEYAQILAESLENDFDKFCDRNKLYVTTVGDRRDEGISFEIPLDGAYSVVLSSIDRKISFIKIHYYSASQMDDTL